MGLIISSGLWLICEINVEELILFSSKKLLNSDAVSGSPFVPRCLTDLSDMIVIRYDMIGFN